LVGKFADAKETLSHADGSALALFYLAKSCFQLGPYDSLTNLQSAKSAGYDSDQCQTCDSRSATAIRQAAGGDGYPGQYLWAERADRRIQLSAWSHRCRRDGNFDEVLRLYNRALQYDDHHPGALFGLALENDRKGNDIEALHLYERAASCFPAHVGT
jgi:DNA-directed RNA polymerase subunit alpha